MAVTLTVTESKVDTPGVGSTITAVYVAANGGGTTVSGVIFTIPLPVTNPAIVWTTLGSSTAGATGHASSTTGATAATLTMPAGSTVTYTRTGLVPAGSGIDVVAVVPSLIDPGSLDVPALWTSGLIIGNGTETILGGSETITGPIREGVDLATQTELDAAAALSYPLLAYFYR